MALGSTAFCSRHGNHCFDGDAQRFVYRFFLKLVKGGTVLGNQQHGSFFGLCLKAIRVSEPSSNVDLSRDH